jgi:diguanylate cyclase (GGDEF)-like protein
MSNSDNGPAEPPAAYEHTDQWRFRAGAARDDSAEKRDLVGDRRDRESQSADDRASLRDQLSDQRDRAARQRETGATVAFDRAFAKSDRDASACDRMNAERDRRAALDDRSAAKANRDVSAAEREVACIDVLTGAYLRRAGILELEREMDRARRTERPLILAFLDIDGLKVINDAEGHAAGDFVLQLVTFTVRDFLRPYDPLIRYGGDEFLSVLWNIDLEDVSDRFQRINTVLSKTPMAASISVGLAEFEKSDTVDTFIARADAALYENRRAHRTSVR